MSHSVRLQDLKGKLIVSCQALPGEALYGSDTMSKMAIAAQKGGAAAIRANSPDDIRAVCRAVDIPVIGLWKQSYPDSDVYITPTYADVEQVAKAGASIVALDATLRHRPRGESLSEIVLRARERLSCMLMADVSTVEEGIYAHKLGFDIISSTLSGYTPYSAQSAEPDFALVSELARQVPIPVFAEGRIRTEEQTVRLLQHGAYAIVIGGAITRPELITRHFVEAINSVAL
ncbi:N-acylglucosamine-6-phosphate 2-epimerase [Paenibacillus taihuensis]|uniref:Putative N-acetylmannosamine-6-phosphate 2-epimerase n=1 Tax=Paenibacillus taihuensis TaxID=1156355 RepID=A0A3D9Q383_9BACL|nr:N-acetylmannosamine-6-phosphate 2-epimerase [Paenibacillus taihuensis]REE55448.1 N-acylglucosamine-6-phosphate 2-epimerase [Paenibacillus taihuensis]